MNAAIQGVYGPPDVLRQGVVPEPKVGEHDVLVQVCASPVTYGDRRLRAGDFPSVFWLPGRLALGLFGPRNRVPGTMFAGRVAAVGAKVTRFSVGDDVFGASLRGAYAERVVLAEDGAIGRMPAGATYADAAALPYGAGTALHFLREMGAVAPGQRVLIVGAAGGVGDFAVQVAKDLGAHVTAVCARRSFDRMRALGADAVLDYATEDFAARGEVWDVVFDASETVGFARARRALTPSGVFLSIGVTVGVLGWSLVQSLFGRRKVRTGGAFNGRESIEELGQWYARGALRPHVRASFPLQRIVEAHAEAERRGADGVVLVTPS